MFATCMAACMVPTGCGAGDEHAAVPEHPPGASLPASTVRALQACAEERAGRLSHRAYEIEFEVDLKGDRVREVMPKGPRLDDAGLERCMMDALRTMADAGFSPDNESQLISRGVLLPARGVLANVSVISQLIRLAPVVVAASGTTIVVVVAVLVVAAAVSLRDATDEEEAEKERCKKVKQGCIEYCADTEPRDSRAAFYPLSQSVHGEGQLPVEGDAMDRDTAEKLNTMTLEAYFKLHDAAALVHASCSADERKEYIMGFGKALGYLYAEVLHPLYKEYPELKPDNIA